MRPGIILSMLVCMFFAGCATEDIKVTGIPRYRAIEIAKSACKEYPDRYSYIDRAEWSYNEHVWVVDITDYRGGRGKTYKVNREGKVVGVEKIGRYDEGYYNDDDRAYRHAYWWY